MTASMISSADAATERLTEHLMPESAKSPSSAPTSAEPGAYEAVLMGATRNTRQKGCLPAPDEHTIAGLSEDQALPAGILVIGSLTSLIGLCVRRRRRDVDNMRYDDYAELDFSRTQLCPAGHPASSKDNRSQRRVICTRRARSAVNGPGCRKSGAMAGRNRRRSKVNTVVRRHRNDSPAQCGSLQRPDEHRSGYRSRRRAT